MHSVVVSITLLISGGGREYERVLLLGNQYLSIL